MKKEDQPKSSPTSENRKKSSLFRLLLAAVIGGGLLLVGGLFLLTSSWFVTGYVLPSAGGVIGSKIEAAGVSGLLSSNLEVVDFNLTPNGKETLVSAKRVALGYDLGAILGGAVVASDLVAEGLTVNVVMKQDGSLNLDPIFEALGEPEPSSGAPPKVDLQRLKVSDSTIRFQIEGANSDQMTIAVTGLNVEADRIGNGTSTRLQVGADLELSLVQDGTSSLLAATLSEDVTLALDEALLPSAIEATLALVVARSEGAFAEFANNRLDLAAKLEGGRLDPVSLSLSKSGNDLGTIKVSGPYDAAAGTAELDFSATGINQNLLNQFQDLLGFSFGQPEISAAGGITLGTAGQALTADAVVKGVGIVLQTESAKTPELAFDLGFGIAVDQTSEEIHIQKLNLEATQASLPFVSLTSAEPIALKKDGDAWKMSGAKLDLGVTDLNLAEWSPVLGEAATGKIGATVSVVATDGGGENLKLSGNVNATDLISPEEVGLASGLGVKANFVAELAGFADVDLSDLRFDVVNSAGALLNGQAMLSVSNGQALALKTQVTVMNQNPTNAQTLPLGIEVRGKIGADTVALENVGISLPTTPRAATNDLVFSGTLTPAPAGLGGRWHLGSKLLDLTPALDFLSSMPQSQTSTAEAEAPEPSPGEPDPISLPITDLKGTLQADKLFAREIEVSDWLAEVAVETQRIKVDPMKLDVNGAPVTGRVDLDLSVPGYRYDIDLDTQQLPAGPFIGSIAPILKGMYDGNLDLGIDVTGVGTTGANLRESLKGGIKAKYQGANIELFDSWKRLFLTPVAMVLRVPKILDSPIQGLTLDTSFGDGSIKLADFEVASPQFRVGSQGEVPIADNLLTSALALPIDFAMKKELAVGANLVKDDAEAIEGYVSLPEFVSLEGALGEPSVNIDKLAVGKLFMRNVAGLPESVVGQAGEALQGLGGLVGGNKDKPNAAGKLLDGVGNLIGGEEGGGLKEAGSALRGLFNRGKKDEEKKE